MGEDERAVGPEAEIGQRCWGARDHLDPQGQSRKGDDRRGDQQRVAGHLPALVGEHAIHRDQRCHPPDFGFGRTLILKRAMKGSQLPEQIPCLPA